MPSQTAAVNCYTSELPNTRLSTHNSNLRGRPGVRTEHTIIDKHLFSSAKYLQIAYLYYLNMYNPEFLHGQEPIDLTDQDLFIEAVCILLPASEITSFDLSDDVDVPEAASEIEMLLLASQTHSIEGEQVRLELRQPVVGSDQRTVVAVKIKSKLFDTDSGNIIRKARRYEVDLDTHQATYHEDTSIRSVLGPSVVISYEDQFRQFKQTIDEQRKDYDLETRLGTNVFTQAKLQEVLAVLSKCGLDDGHWAS